MRVKRKHVTSPHVETLPARLSYALGDEPQQGADLDNALIALLRAVRDAGSIRHAAHALGCSYRHAWGALKRGEQTLGEPLIQWSKGRRAVLSRFAQRLLWTERQARTRMQPHIEALRADLSRMLADARDERLQLLTLHASHDPALSVLQQDAVRSAGLHLDIRFRGSVDSLRALNARECVVAGFHVPLCQDLAALHAREMKRLLRPARHRLIPCMRRRQGLMMRHEHAHVIGSFADVAKLGLRFVNRQRGSGTRLLIDQLLRREAIRTEQVVGYGSQVEDTHVAVAARVASGLADVGAGVQAAALEFGLYFVPLVEEEYFLACAVSDITAEPVRRLRTELASMRWAARLAQIPGYASAAMAGNVLLVTSVFDWWRTERQRAPGR